MIARTNGYLDTEQKFICVSRSRHFGKSMALKMLSAYYSCGCDSKELFEDLKIASDPMFEKYLNEYDVIFLDMQQFLISSKRQESEELQKQYLDFLRNLWKGRDYVALVYMTGILPVKNRGFILH
jgi:hypothetical protein